MTDVHTNSLPDGKRTHTRFPYVVAYRARDGRWLVASSHLTREGADAAAEASMRHADDSSPIRRTVIPPEEN